MSNKKVSTSSGISFRGVLTCLFIALKLTGHIDWNWLWVLGPLWIPLVVLVSLATIWAIFDGIINKFNK